MNLFLFETYSFQTEIVIDVIVKRSFQHILKPSQKGNCSKECFGKKFIWGKKIFCSKWKFRQIINKNFEFFLSVPMPGWLGSDEHWINPFPFFSFFLKPSLSHNPGY